jgi:hypothetical protein
MKDLGKITIQVPNNGGGFVVITDDLETVHTEWSDVEVRVSKYMEKLKREVRQTS